MGGSGRLFIVTPGLYDRHSHPYGEARGWRDACRRRGIIPYLYINRRADPAIVAEYAATPAFTYATDVILDRNPATREQSDFTKVSQQFARDCGVLEKDGIGASDVVVVTYASERDLHGAAIWLERIPVERRPTIAFIFHAPDFGWRTDPQRRRVDGDFSRVRQAMDRLRTVLPTEKAIVLTTSERLTALLRTILQHPCDTAAAPTYFVDPRILESTDARVSGRTTILVAGEYRHEKGSDLVVPVVLRLAAARPGIKFALQVYEEKIARMVRDKLAPMAESPSQCRIDYGQLPHEIYQKRLLLSDILLLPYRWWRYAMRASGVFSEAAGLGIVTVVPDRTWMSDMLAAGWGAGTAFAEPTVNSITAALTAALDAYPALKARAEGRAAEWRRINSVDAVLDSISRRAG